MLNLEEDGVSLQAVRRSGGTGARLGCPCLGAGNCDSFNTILGVGTVCAPAMGTIREGRDMKCKETKGDFTSFSLKWQTLQLQSPL